MNDKTIPKVFVSQIEEALEERQTPDRRGEEHGLPTNIQQERRKDDRRNRRSAKKSG